MPERYRLALDIQTTSIGWALWDLNERHEPVSLRDCGVRIFSEGREPSRNGKTGNSLAVQRRLSRQIRKIRRRNKRRKLLVTNELVRTGLLPQDPEIRCLLKNTHPDCIQKANPQKNREWNPYYLRFQALERELRPYELGRVITHLTAHRGYRSNSNENIFDQNLERKKNLLKIKELEAGIAQSSCRTVGEFLWRRVEYNYHIDCQKTSNAVRQTVRFKPDMVNIFPSRHLYLAEFDSIRKKQEIYFPTILWDKLRSIMYYQRPLKTVERSFCPYYSKTERRGFRCQPSAQRFRILQLLSILTYIDDNDTTYFLTGEQQDILFSILEMQKTLSYTEAAKRIGLPAGGYFSLENRKNQKLMGNETACDMRKPEFFGALWDTFDEETQDDIIYQLIASNKEDDIEACINRFLLSLMQKKNILSYTFKTAVAPYSTKLMRECAYLMRTSHISFEAAIEQLHVHPVWKHTENMFDMLPYYGQVLPDVVILPAKQDNNNPETMYGKIWNPSVHIVFNQIRKITNVLIERYGKPTEINLYIANEVKKSKEGRDDLIRSKLFADAHFNEMREHIRSAGYNWEIRPWQYTSIKLWRELMPFPVNPSQSTSTENVLQEAHVCIYCGKAIMLTDLFDGNAEIAYITPFSQALTNAMNNMTVAHRSCLEYKGTRTPFQAFGSDSENWKAIHERAKYFPVQKRILFRAETRDKKDEVFSLTTPLIDTGFFARKFGEYLSCICKKEAISAFSKNLPSLLHTKWKLHTILGKTRNAAPSDYRSRVLDACILGCIDKGLMKNLQELNVDVWMPPKTKVTNFILPISTMLEKLNKVIISHKPDHSLGGKLFDETAMGMHWYTDYVDTTSITQEDINFLQRKILRKTAQILLEDQGWKRTKEFLFKQQDVLAVMRSRYVTRKKIISCSEKDITRIIDSDLSQRLQKISDTARNDSDRRKVLDSFVQTSGIRRARIIPKGQEVISIASSSNKAYAPSDFLFVDIWEIPHKAACEYRGVFVSRFDAYHYTKESRKPHPAAKFMCRLFKNDTLHIKNDSSTGFYVRVAGFATTQQKIDIRPLCAASTIPQWLNSISPMMIDPFWMDKKSPQNHTAINSIFCSPFKVYKVSISPDGKVK